MEQAIHDLEVAINSVHRIAARLSNAGSPEAYHTLSAAVALTDALNDLKRERTENLAMLREALDLTRELRDRVDQLDDYDLVPRRHIYGN